MIQFLDVKNKIGGTAAWMKLDYIVTIRNINHCWLHYVQQRPNSRVQRRRDGFV